MIQDLTQYTKFLEKYDINAEQFHLLYSLLLDKERSEDSPFKYRQHSAGEERPAANMYRYARKHGYSMDDVDDLEEKGFVENRNPKRRGKQEYKPDNIYVTQKFIDAIYTTYSDFEEFLSAYPPYAVGSNGKSYPLKVVDREELKELYNKHVPDKPTHHKVITAINWADKKGDLLTYKIDKFLTSKSWEDILRLMEQGMSKEANAPSSNITKDEEVDTNFDF